MFGKQILTQNISTEIPEFLDIGISVGRRFLLKARCTYMVLSTFAGRKPDNWFRILCLVSCLLLSDYLGYSQKFEGTIIRVIDGDTYVFLTATGSFTVRMLGIDAPERDQPFSRESSEFLSRYLNMKAVTKVNGTDKDDRAMGTLYVNGRDINLLLIKGGFAWHYKRYSADKDYAAAEEYAQNNKLKIWSLPNPIPPWTWRQRRINYAEQ